MRPSIRAKPSFRAIYSREYDSRELNNQFARIGGFARINGLPLPFKTNNLVRLSREAGQLLPAAMGDGELPQWSVVHPPPEGVRPPMRVCGACLLSHLVSGLSLDACASPNGQAATLCGGCAQTGGQPLTLGSMSADLDQSRVLESFLSFLCPPQAILAQTIGFDDFPCALHWFELFGDGGRPTEAELASMFTDLEFPRNCRPRFRAFLGAPRLLLRPATPLAAHAGNPSSLGVLAADSSAALPRPTPPGSLFLHPNPSPPA